MIGLTAGVGAGGAAHESLKTSNNSDLCIPSLSAGLSSVQFAFNLTKN